VCIVGGKAWRRESGRDHEVQRGVERDGQLHIHLINRKNKTGTTNITSVKKKKDKETQERKRKYRRMRERSMDCSWKKDEKEGTLKGRLLNIFGKWDEIRTRFGTNKGNEPNQEELKATFKNNTNYHPDERPRQ